MRLLHFLFALAIVNQINATKRKDVDALLHSLEAEITTILRNQLDDEKLQKIDGSGDEVEEITNGEMARLMEKIEDSVKIPISAMPMAKNDREQPSQFRKPEFVNVPLPTVITTVTPVSVSTGEATVGTTESTTVNSVTTNLVAVQKLENTTLTAKTFATVTPPTVTRPTAPICTVGTVCTKDSQCPSGRCLGSELGLCDCEACVPNRKCEGDEECGGLRQACDEETGTCNCAKAFRHHGFKLFLHAILRFCKQTACDATSDNCFGLRCKTGNCVCDGANTTLKPSV